MDDREPRATTETVVHYHFPVEVVVAGALTEAERAAIETRIWEQLLEALEQEV